MQMKLKSLYQGLIGFLFIAMIGCGSQDDNQASLSSLESFNQIKATNAYERLTSPFIKASHPITEINLAGFVDTDFSNFTITPLPDYGSAPENLFVYGFIKKSIGFTSYTLDLIPGYLYQFTLKDDNAFYYEVSENQSKQFFKIFLETWAPTTPDFSEIDVYTQTETQTYQPDFETELRSYLYFPESEDCTQSSGCTYPLILYAVLFDTVNKLNVNIQYHQLSIDALPVIPKKSLTNQRYVVRNDVTRFLNGIEDTANYNSIDGRELLEIDEVLFIKKLIPDGHNYNDSPLLSTPPDFWFSTYYVRSGDNKYQYKHDNREYISTDYGLTKSTLAGQIIVTSNTEISHQERFFESYEDNGKAIQDQRVTTGNWYISLPAE